MLIFIRLLCQNKNNWSRLHVRVQRPSPTLQSRFRQTLGNLFGKYLFVTNSLTCGLLMAGGDTIQQHLEKHGNLQSYKGYDWERTGRMLIVGLMQGPPQHLFYKALDRYIPWRNFRSIAVKIFIDQIVASPMCLAIFFLGMGVLEGKALHDNVDEFKKKFCPVYVVDCLVWPPSQVINFYFVPFKYRLLYINCVTMLYDVFLSFMHHNYD